MKSKDAKNLSHVAIIMDGNRRWAKSKAFNVFLGYDRGIDSLRLAIDGAIDFSIKYLTVYAFSKENFNREESEVSYLKNLLSSYLDNEHDFFIQRQIKVKVIGDYSVFGESISKKISKLELDTAHFNKLQFNVALNYSSHQEILRAVNNIIANHKADNTLLVNQELFEKNLYTADIPNPELLIRTGGEKRLSNFMLWQLSYTELVFLDVLWPDFTKEHFGKAIEEYSSRERRLGK